MHNHPVLRPDDAVVYSVVMVPVNVVVMGPMAHYMRAVEVSLVAVARFAAMLRRTAIGLWGLIADRTRITAIYGAHFTFCWPFGLPRQ